MPRRAALKLKKDYRIAALKRLGSWYGIFGSNKFGSTWLGFAACWKAGGDAAAVVDGC